MIQFFCKCRLKFPSSDLLRSFFTQRPLLTPVCENCCSRQISNGLQNLNTDEVAIYFVPPSSCEIYHIDHDRILPRTLRGEPPFPLARLGSRQGVYSRPAQRRSLSGAALLDPPRPGRVLEPSLFCRCAGLKRVVSDRLPGERPSIVPTFHLGNRVFNISQY